jgi:putative PIN family toxin of toxin-antitoxin system
MLTPKGPAGEIIRFLPDPSLYTPIISEDIFAEYIEVINRKKFPFGKTKIDLFLRLILEYSVTISPRHKLDVASEPDDNKFLECALEGKASYMITGNQKHFPLHEYHGTRIVSPSEFLSLIKEKP